jgi:DNA-directed RNA polymerase sigma subunit (sigma70/sigma32)
MLQGRFYNEETLQEIADRHDVCKQRVRQVEGTALRKIRRGEIKNEKMV